MSSYLIIDGYNLIHRIPGLLKALNKSIDFGRDELFGMAAAYCDHNNSEGIIVYDGKRTQRTVERGNPMVVFSKRGESADSVIESFIYQLKDRSQARVVTDDRAVTNMVTGMGAFTMSARLFDKEARQALESIRKSISRG